MLNIQGITKFQIIIKKHSLILKLKQIYKAITINLMLTQIITTIKTNCLVCSQNSFQDK